LRPFLGKRIDSSLHNNQGKSKKAKPLGADGLMLCLLAWKFPASQPTPTPVRTMLPFVPALSFFARNFTGIAVATI